MLVLSTDMIIERAKCEEIESFFIDDNEEKFFQVGVQLPPQGRGELVVFLRKNIDVFAWNAYEAPKVDSSFICHHLNVNPFVISKRQPPRHSSKKHSNAFKEELLKLKQAGAIKEVFYTQ